MQLGNHNAFSASHVMSNIWPPGVPPQAKEHAISMSMNKVSN